MKTILTLVSCALFISVANVAVAADVAAGAAKAKEICSACHGVDGNSTDVNNPRLAGQHADYLAKALRDYKSGKRKNPLMGPQALSLSKQDMKDLAKYYSSLSGDLKVKY